MLTNIKKLKMFITTTLYTLNSNFYIHSCSMKKTLSSNLIFFDVGVSVSVTSLSVVSLLLVSGLNRTWSKCETWLGEFVAYRTGISKLRSWRGLEFSPLSLVSLTTIIDDSLYFLLLPYESLLLRDIVEISELSERWVLLRQMDSWVLELLLDNRELAVLLNSSRLNSSSWHSVALASISAADDEFMMTALCWIFCHAMFRAISSKVEA